MSRLFRWVRWALVVVALWLLWTWDGHAGGLMVASAVLVAAVSADLLADYLKGRRS